ncbi:MAG: heavy metal transport/detoxification protein [Flavipsychrobacter sp.]|nr:heavy metal transport/detoxification protein [Flavipsychrobacter sp.]
MNELKFKTNINCGGCIARVTPFLNKAVGENNWKVDTSVADKVLTIANEEITPVDVVKTLKQVGFMAELLS